MSINYEVGEEVALLDFGRPVAVKTIKRLTKTQGVFYPPFIML